MKSLLRWVVIYAPNKDGVYDWGIIREVFENFEPENKVFTSLRFDLPVYMVRIDIEDEEEAKAMGQALIKEFAHVN